VAGSSPAAKPGPKPTLTRAGVIAAALELIDADGLAALNLRKLAASLGVSAMTPYSYFADKSDLVAAMLSEALSGLWIDPDATAPWDKQLESTMRAMHATLERHPGVIELILAEADSEPLDAARGSLVRMLVCGGLSDRQSRDALRTLMSYILGYTMLTRLRGGAPRRRGSARSFDQGLAALMDAVRSMAARGGRPPAPACDGGSSVTARGGSPASPAGQ
jgi:AcrR family transcriptional regulator